jgi:glycosyltransferase involved in cell wall biosynthesis
MRLLVLHSQLGTLRGGGENFSRNLFTAFASLGHRVQVAFAADPVGRYPFSLPDVLEPLPIRGWWFENLGQATLSAIGRKLTPFPGVRRKWDYAQAAVSWRTFYWSNRHFQSRVLKSVRPMLRDVDAVYVHSNPHLASEVARLRPTVLRLPGPLTSEMLPVLRSIHAVCANGDALTRIRTFLGDHALELPVGLDDERFSPGPTATRGALGWTSEHRVVGYVGRLSHIKGVDVLAEAFRQLFARDRSTRLLMIGTGEEANNLRTTLAAEIAAGAVHLAGDIAHDRLPDFYRAMDVLVMPSRYENFSNAILEGLACGVPFVGSDVGGNRALSETGAAWLFQPGSAEDLARLLAVALSDIDSCQSRGQRGRAFVAGRYNWTATARRLEAIIDGLPATVPVGATCLAANEEQPVIP